MYQSCFKTYFPGLKVKQSSPLGESKQQLKSKLNWDLECKQRPYLPSRPKLIVLGSGVDCDKGRFDSKY